MSTAGIRELKQNASAVVAEAIAGETVVITDRGRPVAQLVPLPEGPYAAMVAAGLIRPATLGISDLPVPEEGEPVSPVLEAMRNDERYQGVHYLDTSALVKLIVAEESSAAMRAWIEGVERPVVTSDLTRTELMRAVTRVHPDRAPRVRALLDSVQTVGLTRRVLDEAGRLSPPALRSLDAIHLAVALSFGDDLESMVTYDDRLGEAAALAGLRIEAPRD